MAADAAAHASSSASSSLPSAPPRAANDCTQLGQPSTPAQLHPETSCRAATTRGGGAATPTPTAPTASVFFHEEAVRVGERLPLHFRAAAPAALGLLPRGVADSIPFTAAALSAVLALLGVPPGSSRAAAMAETLRTCERPPSAGATAARFGATSLEALVERAVAALGTRDVRAVTSALPRSGMPPQLYAVRAVRRVGGCDGASGEQLRQLRFDLDADGRLTKLELAALLRSLGLRPAVGDKIHALIAAMDADSNDTVEFNELVSSLAPLLLGPCRQAVAVDHAQLAKDVRDFDREAATATASSPPPLAAGRLATAAAVGVEVADNLAPPGEE